MSLAGFPWEAPALGLLAIGVGLGCLLPLTSLPPLPNDKLLHFLAFGALGWLAARLVQGLPAQAAVLALVLLASWCIEVLQNLVPGRRFCWRDMAANAAGVLAAGVLLLVAHGVHQGVLNNLQWLQ